jgi:hypothetical protein
VDIQRKASRQDLSPSSVNPSRESTAVRIHEKVPQKFPLHPLNSPRRKIVQMQGKPRLNLLFYEVKSMTISKRMLEKVRIKHK